MIKNSLKLLKLSALNVVEHDNYKELSMIRIVLETWSQLKEAPCVHNLAKTNSIFFKRFRYPQICVQLGCRFKSLPALLQFKPVSVSKFFMYYNSFILGREPKNLSRHLRRLGFSWYIVRGHIFGINYKSKFRVFYYIKKLMPFKIIKKR